MQPPEHNPTEKFEKRLGDILRAYDAQELDGRVGAMDQIIDAADTLAAERVEEFATRLKERLRALPRHRPSNTSLWDGVQMERAIAEVDAELTKTNFEETTRG
jgi:hypothetical protein